MDDVRAVMSRSVHIRFSVPDAVLDLPDQWLELGTWMNGDDPDSSSLLEVPSAGTFVRCLLPIKVGPAEIVYGIWAAVSEETFSRIFAAWYEPIPYSQLSFSATLANNIPDTRLTDADIFATVLIEDALPVVTRGDSQVAPLLTTP